MDINESKCSCPEVVKEEFISLPFDANNDGIEDDVHIKVTQDSDGNRGYGVDEVILKDWRGQSICDEDYFMMVDGYKLSEHDDIICGSEEYVGLRMVVVPKIIFGLSGPALFGHLVQLDDGEFINVNLSTRIYAINKHLKWTEYDISQCHPTPAFINYSIATDGKANFYDRLDAAAELVEMGEIELAREAYSSISAGDNKVYTKEFRLEAAKALVELLKKYHISPYK